MAVKNEILVLQWQAGHKRNFENMRKNCGARQKDCVSAPSQISTYAGHHLWCLDEWGKKYLHAGAQ